MAKVRASCLDRARDDAETRGGHCDGSPAAASGEVCGRSNRNDHGDPFVLDLAADSAGAKLIAHRMVGPETRRGEFLSLGIAHFE